MTSKFETSPICCCTIIHQDVVDQVKAGLPRDGALGDMAELFKCVCDIGALLEMSTPAISHHLKVLRQLKLVTFRRAGKIVYYTVADDHIAPILLQAQAHIGESNNG